MPKVILFYTPFIRRSRDTETLMIAFKKQGHRVLTLSQESGVYTHEFLQTQGIETYSHEIAGTRNALYFLKQALFLVQFCRKNKVQILYSHLEAANYTSVLASWLISARIFVCRHHMDEAALYGFDKLFYYRLTYGLARKIIVVSEATKKYMMRVEGISERRIKHINLAYDFGFYNAVEPDAVDAIKKRNPSDVLLLSAGRFIRLKRIMLSIDVLIKLRNAGINARLILLGSGDEEEKIQQYIRDHNLTDFIETPGYVNSVINYLKAADFLLHPSISESSCVIVKEAGLTNTPVVVCKGVGDFDDYLVHEENAFLVDKEKFADEAAGIIEKNYKNQAKLHAIASKLDADVHKLFSIESILPLYDALNS